MASVEFAVRTANFNPNMEAFSSRPPTMVDYFGVKNLPSIYYQVPNHEKRIEIGPKYSISTSAHEGNHYFVGLTCGYTPEYISVIPQGETLGFVAFSGVDYEDFKVVAAGGSVSTFLGPAEGDGMDRFVIDLLHSLKGGISRAEAYGKAKNILDSIPTSLKVRFAELLAHVGSADGETAAQMLELAEKELLYEQNEEVIASNWKEDLLRAADVAKAKEGTVVIETLVGDQYRIIYLDGKDRMESFTTCGLCRGINGHAENCPINTKIDKEERRSSPADVLDTVAEVFSNEVIIFDSKNI